MSFSKSTAVAAALLLATAATQAAPFATTHTGTITASTLPGAIDGEPYRFTLIFDNGGTTAAGQNWSRGDLTCVIVRVGNAGAEFRQDLRVHLADTLNTFATMPDGSVRRIFSGVRNTAVQAGEYTTNGLVLEEPVGWGYWVPGGSIPFVVLQDRNGQRSFSGDSIWSYSAWSSPVAVAGACDDTPLNAPPPPGPRNATAVPALGAPALALLGLGAAALGARRLRRRPHQS